MNCGYHDVSTKDEDKDVGTPGCRTQLVYKVINRPVAL